MSAISEFLRQYYSNSTYNSHVSLHNPPGKFQLNRDRMEVFWKTYKKCIPNQPLGVAEIPQKFLPVIADIDLKLEVEINETPFNLYTETELVALVKIFQNVIKHVVENYIEQHSICFVLEKDPYKVTKNSITYIKNGCH